MPGEIDNSFRASKFFTSITVMSSEFYLTHQYDSAYSADDIASEIQVTRVKYNQYTLCRLKVLAKWLKICRVMIKRVLIFLEGIVCKHLLVWAFFFQSTFTF
jgi:hypothetical protein